MQKERDKSKEEIERVVEEERRKAQQLLAEEQVSMQVFTLLEPDSCPVGIQCKNGRIIVDALS